MTNGDIGLVVEPPFSWWALWKVSCDKLLLLYSMKCVEGFSVSFHFGPTTLSAHCEKGCVSYLVESENEKIENLFRRLEWAFY